jgi:hypothetical protein
VFNKNTFIYLYWIHGIPSIPNSLFVECLTSDNDIHYQLFLKRSSIMYYFLLEHLGIRLSDVFFLVFIQDFQIIIYIYIRNIMLFDQRWSYDLLLIRDMI